MIYLTAGHNTKDPGAVYNGRKEATETIRLRDALTTALRAKNLTVWNDNDNSDLNAVITAINNQSKQSDIILDLHFNAGSPAATGTEVLTPAVADTAERNLASALVNAIASTLIIRNRGVKTEADSQHKRLGIMKPTGINILIEVCFISNVQDMKNYDTYFDKLVNAISDVLATHHK